MGKYSLISSLYNKSYSIPLEEYDYAKKMSKYTTKVNLSTIDKITTNFWSKEDLIDFLITHNMVSYIPDDLYITYNYKGEHILPLAFKTNPYISHFSKISSTYIPLDNTQFQKFAYDFIKDVEKDNTILYKEYIYQYLKDKFLELFENNHKNININSFIIKKIIEQLAVYKQSRCILMNNSKYFIKKPLEIYKLSSFDEEVMSVYNTQGLEGIYNIYSLDELEKLSNHVKRLIR